MVKDDEEDERLKEMREQYASMLSKTGEEYKDRIKEQNMLDKDFEGMVDTEYADDQIGELDDEDIEQEDLITNDLLLAACDEYIESQKTGRSKGRKLYQRFKKDGEPDDEDSEGDEGDDVEEEG
jgi:hypothetical protein